MLRRPDENPQGSGKPSGEVAEELVERESGEAGCRAPEEGFLRMCLLDAEEGSLPLTLLAQQLLVICQCRLLIGFIE